MPFNTIFVTLGVAYFSVPPSIPIGILGGTCTLHVHVALATLAIPRLRQWSILMAPDGNVDVIRI